MRIVVICPQIRPGGGPQGYTYNLREAVAAQHGNGSQEWHFIGAGTEDRFTALESRSALHEVARRVDGLTRGLVRFLHHRTPTRRMLDKRNRELLRTCDVLLVQGFQPTWAVRYARRRGARIGYMAHSPTSMADQLRDIRADSDQPMSAREHRQVLRLEAALIALSDLVVFPSAGASTVFRAPFQDVLPEAKVGYVASGVPDPGPAQPERVDQNRILFAGRYVSHKGFDLFCAAAEVCATRAPELVFAAIGAGPIAASHAVTDLGWRADPFEEVRRSGIVVVPNRVAFFDLLPLECAALGRPIVFTAVGGNVDQAALLPDSRIAAPADPEALAEQIIQARAALVASPTWGAANVAAYQQHFSLGAMATAWRRLVDDLGGR